MKDDTIGKSGKFSGTPSRGTVISHFRIVRKIGSTALGEVYLGEDTGNDRKVTLKLLSEIDSVHQHARLQLLEGARIVSKLRHPNMLTVYEVGRAGGQDFIAMEYVEGLTLRQMMSAGQLSVDGVIEIARQVCGAMTEAHKNEIILQNINPDNITVTSERQVKMMDFGMVDFAGDIDLKHGDIPYDIIAYLSPEYIRGREVDERSNIFSIGVVLYEMMTGLTPFRGNDNRELMDSIQRENVQPPVERNPDVPAELQEMVMKMLEKNPARRYQSAIDVISELSHFKKTEPASIQRVRRKDPWNWVVVAAVIILIIVALYSYISDYLSN